MLKAINKGIEGLGRWAEFSIRVFKTFTSKGVSSTSLVEQMYHVGVRSLPITIVSGLFVGAILAIQINLQLKDFGAQTFLGGLSTSTTLRNLGPVLIAFLLSGRVGAFTSAELGTMAITDQLNAIRCLGMDPVEKIVVPRLVALTCSSFLLLILGLGMTVVGGVVISSAHLGVNPIQFSQNISLFVSSWSIGIGVVKSFLFGLMIGTISCFFGYHTAGGARGVGRAVKRTSVATLVSIILMDFLVSTALESLKTFFEIMANS
ncbi:MAG: ABC transporter permease [Proteobacteria bacterium]|nr:ABC transporter permease [Pseudomonadota bacterium]